MTLLREALDIGAFPSTETVRRAFEILENELGRPSTLTDDEQTDIDTTLDEIRDTIEDEETCRRVRQIFQDLGILGCASARRIAAIAASLGIDPEVLNACLEKTDEEREDEADAEIDLELELPEEPPVAEDEECPVDLVTWLCIPEEDLPEDVATCDPAPLPGADDTRTYDPFPTVPDVDDAAELCRFAENKIRLAQGTGEILSASTLTGFLRMFHALAFRPNPPPGVLYKTRTETALDTLTQYWASGLVPPPTEPEATTLEQISDHLDQYRTEVTDALQHSIELSEGFLQDADFYGLTHAEAAPWLTKLTTDRAAAAALQDHPRTERLDSLISTINAILDDSTPDPFRPLPPGLEIPTNIPDIDTKTRHDLVDRYLNFLQDKLNRGLSLDRHESEYLTEHFKGEELP